MVAHVRCVQVELERQSLLNGKIPRLDVGILERQIDHLVCLGIAARQNAVRRNGVRYWCGNSCLKRRRLATWEQCRTIAGPRRYVLVISGDREIEGIAIVGKGRIADAEPAADDSLLA